MRFALYFLAIIITIWELVHFPFILAVWIIPKNKTSKFRDFSDKFLLKSYEIHKRIEKKVIPALKFIFAKLKIFVKWLLERYNKPYELQYDYYFVDYLCEIIKRIISEETYQHLYNLSETNTAKPFIAIYHDNELFHIDISVYCDDFQKAILERILKQKISLKLSNCGYYDVLLTEWKFREDYQMPYFEVRFAFTEKEKEILHQYIDEKNKKIIMKNSKVTDDTEDEDLT